MKHIVFYILPDDTRLWFNVSTVNQSGFSYSSIHICCCVPGMKSTWIHCPQTCSLRNGQSQSCLPHPWNSQWIWRPPLSDGWESLAPALPCCAALSSSVLWPTRWLTLPKAGWELGKSCGPCRNTAEPMGFLRSTPCKSDVTWKGNIGATKPRGTCSFSKACRMGCLEWLWKTETAGKHHLVHVNNMSLYKL